MEGIIGSYWIGKLVGGLLGGMSGGWPGAIVGLIVGHWFDRALSSSGRSGPRFNQSRKSVHTAFFRGAFVAMGHVCKADGRVSESEIRAVEAIMARMDLNAEQRQQAIKFFHSGRDDQISLDEVISDFRKVAQRHRQLCQLFVEIQIQAALADGRIDASERALLQSIALGLGFSQTDYARLEQMLHGHATGQPDPESTLEAAYETLGVKSTDSDSEVKRAWRKLMSEHHPDKLVARGLPEEMMRIAKERTQEIQSAYETIKQARGLR